jgi:hypothetical protein
MTTRRRARLCSLALATAATLLLVPVLLASAATSVAFTISDPRITQSSGLARDPGSDVYWTVNRAGEEGTVYGLNPDGSTKGVVGFRAKPVDVEAVAVHGRRLYVADIGDATRKRSSVSVYYFDSPKADNLTVPYRSYDFSYPDGPHHAKTLLINGDGRLFVVTKEAKGAVYEAPASPSHQGVNRLTRVAGAPAFVTDGVFLPDGKIALRTYASVEVVDPSSYKTTARAATPYQKQGESLAVSLDGKSLLVGSAGKDSQVLRMAVPTRLGEVPAGTVTPPPSSTPTPSASSTPSSSSPAEDDEPVEDTSPQVSRAGTILALSVAAFVALVAGVVVTAKR